MRRFALLALLLTVAGCGTAGVSVTSAPVSMIETLAVADSYPLDGVFIYRPDPKCPGRGVIIPDLAMAFCMRAEALNYLIREVAAARVRPGPAWTSCSYPSDPNWKNCVEYAIKAAMPEIRFGQSPRWLTGSIQGVPWTGCAAGVASHTFIRVSLADESRIMRLVAWETSNVLLAHYLDLYASADGPITAAATNYAAQACGAN
jgi:hypothetical protein